MSKPTAWKHDNSLQQCRLKRKDRPAQILAGQLPHAIELLLHVFSSAAPPLELGKVNGASVREGSAAAATARPSRPKQTRSGYFQNFNAVLQVLQKEQTEERRRLELHGSPWQPFTESAASVGGRGSVFTSPLCAVRRRLTCDPTAQKTRWWPHGRAQFRNYTKRVSVFCGRKLSPTSAALCLYAQDAVKDSPFLLVR